jgi:hypothetical protein
MTISLEHDVYKVIITIIERELQEKHTLNAKSVNN